MIKVKGWCESNSETKKSLQVDSQIEVILKIHKYMEQLCITCSPQVFDEKLHILRRSEKKYMSQLS